MIADGEIMELGPLPAGLVDDTEYHSTFKPSYLATAAHYIPLTSSSLLLLYIPLIASFYITCILLSSHTSIYPVS
jgi:hypothetical protein